MTEFKLNEVDTLRQYALFKYIFTPTIIGSSVDILCPYCGKVKNIKYFDSW